MIANYHGDDVDLGTLRRRFRPSIRGASLRSLIEMADQLGLLARPVTLPLQRLKELQLPAILHWNMNHYVVLEAVQAGKAIICDPEGSSRAMSMDEVSNHFTGVAVELKATAGFRPREERQRLHLSQLWQRIRGLKRAVVQTIVLSIVLECIVLVSPYYLQTAIDRVLPSRDISLLTILAVGFALLAIVNSGATLLRSFVLLSAGAEVAYGIVLNVARHLLRLPIDWFEKRQLGDILSRFQSVGPIRTLMTDSAVASIVDGAFAVATLLVMLLYSIPLTVLALFALCLYGCVRWLSFALQRSVQEEALVSMGREQSVMVETLRGITTLRLFGSESSRLSVWQSRYVESLNASIGLDRIRIWQNTSSVLIFGLESVVSIWFAIHAVVGAQLSVGMVFAFMAYKVQLVQKVMTLVDQAILLRMAGLHLDRISDIALAEEDVSFRIKAPNEAYTLEGKLEAKDVVFRYGPNDPLVLSGVNLSVGPGDYVAITGPSGGGKSTLIKLLLGLVEPTEGEILADGMPLGKFGYGNFHAQVSAVLQEDCLFAGSLADNVALFDENPDFDRIISASQAAGIYEDVRSMPCGFETRVGDMGSALSGGQKQRILLARALYRKPRLLIMDEGTSHLDIELEESVNAAISDLGITRVVVAHRLETTRHADRIYMLRGGRLADVTASWKRGGVDPSTRFS